MAAKVTNNAYGTLSAGITNTATTLTLNSGEGARFPALGAGDYFYATLVDTSNNLEIIKVTARSVDSMTIVRGQDGTTARAYGLNDRLELRPTAALFNEKADTAYVDTEIAALDAAKLANVSPGSAGNVMTSTGSGWTSSAPSTPGFANMQVFTTTNAAWSIPATRLKVTVVAGGGKGGNGTSGYSTMSAGGGGGGGGTAIEIIEGLTIGATVSVTVGAAGGSSSFGAYCSATAGATASNPSASSGGWAAGGLGGIGSGGNLNIRGGPGGNSCWTGSWAMPGAGGDSFMGGGGNSSNVVGGAYGGGGSGGSSGVGANGAAGVVIVEW